MTGRSTSPSTRTPAWFHKATLIVTFTIMVAFGLLTPGETPRAEAASRSITLQGVQGAWPAGYKSLVWGKAIAGKHSKSWVQVQRKTAGNHWKTITTVRVTKGQHYNWKASIIAPKKPARYQYRVRLLQSRHGKVQKTSAVKTVRVTKASPVMAAIADSTPSTWTAFNTDSDPRWDAMANDADRNGYYEDVYVDSDRFASHRLWDVRFYNSYGHDSFLENVLIDRNYDGRYDAWMFDVDQRIGFDYYYVDNDFDGYWDQPSAAVVNTEAIGILGDMQVAGMHVNGFFEPCGRTNCQRPGL